MLKNNIPSQYFWFLIPDAQHFALRVAYECLVFANRTTNGLRWTVAGNWTDAADRDADKVRHGEKWSATIGLLKYSKDAE